MKWRTVITILFLGVLLLLALVVCVRAGSDMAAKVFTDFAWGIVFLGAAQAGKSTAQALGQGSGVRGAIAALMTDAKPGQPPAPAPAGGQP